jgi:hypothetical protein
LPWVVSHALVDLATIFKTPPKADATRLSTEVLLQLRSVMSEKITALRPELLSEDKPTNLIEMYEPYANALGRHFLMALPPWVPGPRSHDNWQTASWGNIASPFAVSDPFLVAPGENED